MKFNDNDILTLLKAPFSPDSLSWRVGNKSNWDKVNKKPKNPNAPVKAQMLVYIDARDVQERLDEICGMSWENSFQEISGRQVCTITINGKSRSDGAGDTDFEGEKGGLSDAFKRSAVQWGIGRYLYNAKNFNTWLKYDGEETDFDMPAKAKETFKDIAIKLGETVLTYEYWLNAIDNCENQGQLDEIRDIAGKFAKRECWNMSKIETMRKHIEQKKQEFKDKN